MRQAPAGVLKRLGEWQRAGVITADVASRIADYEAKRGRPALLYAIFGLGGFAVVVGLVAIIAANWAQISGATKLTIDIAICAFLSFLVVRPPDGERGFVRETAIFILFGLTLASIGLIAQVYNLGGKPYQALLTWLVLTTALVFHGRGAFTATVWGVGATATVGYWTTDFINSRGFSSRVGGEIFITVTALVPLALIALGEWGFLDREKNVFARAFRRLGWAEAISLAMLAQLLWYTKSLYRAIDDRPWIALGIASAATAALSFAKARSLSSRVLLAFILISASAPVFILHDKIGWLSALSFVGLWAIIAWDAYGEGNSTLLNLATGLIALRIVIAYIEVFGSLLSTGISLLSGGLLTIGLAALWVRQSRKFRQELRA